MMTTESLQLLLIEDDAIDRAAILSAIQGHRVTTYGTPAEGLDAAHSQRFDCILLMLDPSSLDTPMVEAISSTDLGTPVVVLTSSPSSIDTTLLRLGVQDVLPVHPLPPALLNNSIRHAIERTRIRQQLRSTRSQFIQAQRMEAFGQLAGGIAHDFNNLLSIIQLFTSFVRKTLDEDDERAADLDEVLQASTRAASLIKQMLTFTRQKPSSAMIISLRAHIQRIEPQLRQILGVESTLNIELPEKDVTVRIEPALLEQVMVGLTENARDAMPSGGRLELRVRHTLESALITITDTGVGMSDSTLLRAIEPFFTTKEEERMGLGLSMCQGIIEQASGTLKLSSRPSQGSTITITLPTTGIAASDAAPSPPEPTRLSGTERILLVEDIEKLRRSLSRTLTEHGYAVVEASNGLEALEVLQHEEVDLVLTDLVMPMLSGTALAKTLSETSPELPIVLMTGYAKRYSDATHPCILKPFKLPELLSIIRGQLAPAQTLSMN